MSPFNFISKFGTAKVFIFSFFFFNVFPASAQTLSNVSVNETGVCAGSEITVSFTANDGLFSWYSSSSVFHVYLEKFGQSDILLESFSVSGLWGFWSSTNISRTVTLPEGVTGTNFRIRMNSSNPGTFLGLSSRSGYFTIINVPQGGSIQNQIVCAGSVPNNMTLSGHQGQIVRWEKSAYANFATKTNIAVTSSTLPGSSIGTVTGQVYVRALVQSGSCQGYSSTATISLNNNTAWTGATNDDWHVASNWSCGVPRTESIVTIPGESTVIINDDAVAGSINTGAGSSVTVKTGSNLSVTNALAVADGADFKIENNANLLQINNVSNTGKIKVVRNSSALKRQDYTLWSSPVQGQNLKAFSPLTVSSPTSRFYTYNTNTNQFNSVTTPQDVDFSLAKGYLIRVPNNHPTWAATWTGVFEGTPNNGTITMPLVNAGPGKRYNLVGNPYPSPIKLADFVSQNSANITGVLHFWRKTNNAASPSYCSWTAIGGFVSNGEAQVYDPNSILQTGQGFFVEARNNATSVQFNNTQRVGNNTGQFFRTDEVERHRIWLNLTSETGAFSQTLVGYFEGATLEEDQHIDAVYMNDGEIALTSTVSDVDYTIQGRPLPFETSDIVALKFKTATAGTYTIAIDHVDGLFLDGQQVFLNDKLTGASHNLTESAYQFNSEAGTFADRFEITYGSALSVGDNEIGINDVRVFAQGGTINVHSGNATMETVQVYDIHGRMIANLKSINGNEAVLNAPVQNQVLIVKIVTVDNKTVSKKVVN